MKMAQPARAQQGVKRTDLQRHDLSIPGREAIQVRVEIEPGVLAPRHTHFGEEIIYVLEGSLEYEIEGKPPVTLKARRRPVHPSRGDPLGQKRRQRQRR